jgi:hypothetical protein
VFPSFFSSQDNIILPWDEIINEHHSNVNETREKIVRADFSQHDLVFTNAWSENCNRQRFGSLLDEFFCQTLCVDVSIGPFLCQSVIIGKLHLSLNCQIMQ